MTNWDSRALAVVQQLRRSGHQAVLVGGCVRDSLLSIPPHDYDVTTSALPWEILSCCAGFPCLNTGLKHGTVTVLSGGLSVEVTTFRREGSYSDHRHPDQVEFTSDLTDDLARRDFTINAMAWGSGGTDRPVWRSRGSERSADPLRRGSGPANGGGRPAAPPGTPAGRSASFYHLSGHRRRHPRPRSPAVHGGLGTYFR